MELRPAAAPRGAIFTDSEGGNPEPEDCLPPIPVQDSWGQGSHSSFQQAYKNDVMGETT